MRQSALVYYFDSCIAPLAVLVLIVYAALHADPLWLAFLVPGLLGWTFVEYLIHRYIYHHVPGYVGLHDAHHKEPTALIGSPPGSGTILILIVVMLPLSYIGEAVGLGFGTGFLAGYALYQTAHHAVHFWKARHGSFLYRLRLHHMRHHYGKEEGNFGVSTPLWDHVFGTLLQRRGRQAAEPNADPIGS